MATTTNYSWTTPDDTALVKDGAAAIRSLGTAIDTTVFNNASAAIAKTIVDAKGDIIAATAADTVSRLAVGANDTVLTADSSTATGLKWATPASGGMTVLASGSLGTAGIDLTSISSSYETLLLIINDLAISNSTDWPKILINNDSTGGNYSGIILRSTNTTSENNGGQELRLYDGTNNYTSGDNNNIIYCTFPNYANTASEKLYQAQIKYTSAGPTFNSVWTFGSYKSTTAINRLNFRINNTATFTQGTYRLIGVK